MDRPAIPMEIQRAVLLEAGHRCAIPTCRHPRVEIHHIIPWAICRKHEYHNLIALCPNCHTQVHDGEIDRKSLSRYKAALLSHIREIGNFTFDQPIVEIKRHIHCIDTTHPEIYFYFEFPEFCNQDVVASKNIEAWGIELLEWHNTMVSQYKKDAIESGRIILGVYLTGRYDIHRRDSTILSVRYTIEGFLGGAHGYIQTRVQNFLLNPFTPLTLDYFLISESSLVELCGILRRKIEEEYPYLSGDWLTAGTIPSAISSTPFVVGSDGVLFMFAEYQVGGYAQGSPEIHLSFYELRGIAKSTILASLDGS